MSRLVSKATRFSYALMLLASTFLAVAMLTDALKSWLLSTFHAAWSIPNPPVSTRHTMLSATCRWPEVMASIGNSLRQGLTTHVRGQDCDGLDCWSPEAIQRRAQNAMVDSARDSADEALTAKLERLVGALAVNRVMLGVVIFHAIMSVCLCGVKSSSDARAKLQNGAWGIKLLLYVGLIAAMFWLESDTFESVTTLFRLGAFCFVLVQLTMLIESAYVTENYLGEKRATHGPGWLYLSLLCVALMYGFFIFVFVVTIAKNQNEPEGCSEGVWAVMVNFLLMILTTCLSIVRTSMCRLFHSRAARVLCTALTVTVVRCRAIMCAKQRMAKAAKMACCSLAWSQLTPATKSFLP